MPAFSAFLSARTWAQPGVGAATEETWAVYGCRGGGGHCECVVLVMHTAESIVFPQF